MVSVYCNGPLGDDLVELDGEPGRLASRPPAGAEPSANGHLAACRFRVETEELTVVLRDFPASGGPTIPQLLGKDVEVDEGVEIYEAPEQ